jgi:ABC-type transport system substrate-binding protein
VRKDEHFNLQPWLAASWERPDPLTWVFHLRPGVRFHDGHPLTSADVAYTLRSMTDGTLITAKGGAFKSITLLDTPDALTVIVRTKTPDASLLFNLSDGLFGVVERGATADEGLHPVGSGPFRFVSQVQDKDVIVERNPTYWGGAPSIERVNFEVVPDTISTALEMRKGSGDVESNVLTLDMARASTTPTSTSPTPCCATSACVRRLPALSTATLLWRPSGAARRALPIPCSHPATGHRLLTTSCQSTRTTLRGRSSFLRRRAFDQTPTAFACALH